MAGVEDVWQVENHVVAFQFLKSSCGYYKFTYSELTPAVLVMLKLRAVKGLVVESAP